MEAHAGARATPMRMERLRLAQPLPRVDSNHDSAVQSRMSCHWTTGQTSGAMEINRSPEAGQMARGNCHRMGRDHLEILTGISG